MNNYELYINKQSIDLETKFTFALIYQSPIFTDITKIASNRTTTVKIPKTANNLRAIQNCQEPDNTTPFPYKTHAVELLKNGIPIIRNGTMILLAVNDYIELSIIWGNKTNKITELQNKKLRELNANNTIPWNDDTANRITNLKKNFGFAGADFGQGNNIQYKHPFVSINWILDRIKTDVALAFVFPENNDVVTEKEKLFIPLVEKNTIFEPEEYKFYINKNLEFIPGDNPGGIIHDNTINIQQPGAIYFKGDWTFTAVSVAAGLEDIESAEINFFRNEEDAESLKVQATIIDTAMLVVYCTVTFDKENASMEVKKGDKITVKVNTISGGKKLEGKLATSGNQTLTAVFTESTAFGGRFPIVPNLPDITCLDLIKNIMLLFGLFACYDPKSSNTIKFFSVDEIYRRKPDAKDWTDKLTTGNQIESITFTFQDYAQKNRIRYLKDETVTVNADGAIEINNTTLEKEKDLAELKFAASDEKNGFIYIPLYTRNEKGEIEYKKTTSRIALMNFSNASSIARFPLSFYPAGMAFDGINYGRIRKYYQKYREIIAQPKVIEATFLLNEPDLYGLDLLTPVYLEQTGKYYAIIDMNASEKGAKCKLLQM